MEMIPERPCSWHNLFIVVSIIPCANKCIIASCHKVLAFKLYQRPACLTQSQCFLIMHLPTSFCRTGALPLQFLSSWAPAVCMPVQQRDGRDIVTTCVSTTSNQITTDTKSHNLSRITLCWAQLWAESMVSKYFAGVGLPFNNSMFYNPPVYSNRKANGHRAPTTALLQTPCITPSSCWLLVSLLLAPLNNALPCSPIGLWQVWARAVCLGDRQVGGTQVGCGEEHWSTLPKKFKTCLPIAVLFYGSHLVLTCLMGKDWHSDGETQSSCSVSFTSIWAKGICLQQKEQVLTSMCVCLLSHEWCWINPGYL